MHERVTVLSDCSLVGRVGCPMTEGLAVQILLPPSLSLCPWAKNLTPGGRRGSSPHWCVSGSPRGLCKALGVPWWCSPFNAFACTLLPRQFRIDSFCGLTQPEWNCFSDYYVVNIYTCEHSLDGHWQSKQRPDAFLNIESGRRVRTLLLVKRGASCKLLTSISFL